MIMGKEDIPQPVWDLGSLLREAQKAHHQAFIETDGYHPDWPIWYAEYLVDKLSDHLGEKMTRSEIIYNLVLLDKKYTAEEPEMKWFEYYARHLLDNYV